MSSALKLGQQEANFNERLATSGFRFTPQRQHVYNILLEKRSHPTAEELFMQAKRTMPDISLATVYNCLDALVKCGLVRQVNLDRWATRFCPNMAEHGHFCCEQCGGVYDIEMPAGANLNLNLPPGFQMNHCEISFRGVCRKCAEKLAQ